MFLRTVIGRYRRAASHCSLVRGGDGCVCPPLLLGLGVGGRSDLGAMYSRSMIGRASISV